MQEKHTQGPWEVSFSQINAGKHECIVQFGFNIRENPKAYANARLIAAAPELLAALSELVAMNNCNYDRALMQKAFEKAQSTINKAKGI